MISTRPSVWCWSHRERSPIGTLDNSLALRLHGLAEEKDLIVLVTTGGQPAESMPVDIPANARVTGFLPYEHILPKVDLVITNGGYGTVNMALAHGIPIVSAGLTEDKEEVSANVQWSGAGIDLRTNQADPEMVYVARLGRFLTVRSIATAPGNWQKSMRNMTQRPNCSICWKPALSPQWKLDPPQGRWT